MQRKTKMTNVKRALRLASHITKEALVHSDLTFFSRASNERTITAEYQGYTFKIVITCTGKVIG